MEVNAKRELWSKYQYFWNRIIVVGISIILTNIFILTDF